MPYILNIHTATETAIVNLARDGKILQTKFNKDTREHAAFLHPVIDDIMKKEGISMNKLDAIAVTSGPGSYTGIRVGLAAAKGLCYALNIPLITFNTLEAMALSAAASEQDEEAFYCPMIDARRMEVFTALYSYNLKELDAPSAKILNENSFKEFRDSGKVIFSGSGSKKFKELVKSVNFSFIETEILSESLAEISSQKFNKLEFDNVISTSPVYIKDFYTP